MLQRTEIEVAKYQTDNTQCRGKYHCTICLQFEALLQTHFSLFSCLVRYNPVKLKDSRTLIKLSVESFNSMLLKIQKNALKRLL